MRAIHVLASILGLFSFGAPCLADEIPIPDDAPQPLSPAESAAAVELPEGFRLELIAAEPLIRNPSGVCWDERGRVFVCELNGYNLEGQYDIEELNKTGELDKVVRRLPAPEDAKKRAEQDQTGAVKRLVDTDGDGRMDEAKVWANDLPMCFGIVPARGGVIVVCSPHIVYLADRDGDDVPEIRETLFTGFHTGIPERRMNAPQWGIDNWIYIGRGQGGSITGPRLDGTVELPRNDFRFKADGSAIEPVPEGTHTFGFAFSETGDRFVVSTRTPAIYVAPIPWRYLSRNPHMSFGSLTVDIGPGTETYPASQPHPWRARRADDPGFEEYYRSRYGAAESAPNGYFTSGCSPLVYQDTALPGLRGHVLACEPAQNMVHRSIMLREGLVPRLVRPESEQRSEFLASRDIWFHPIFLTHAPDGSIVIADFYREIIEDYSAIPRYLQQQYRLDHGEKHGRVWRLVHEGMVEPPEAGINELAGHALASELSSPRFWRRQTAQRLIVERQDEAAIDTLRSLILESDSVATMIGAIYALDGLGNLSASDLRAALRHENAGVIVQALRLSDQRFGEHPLLVSEALNLLDHPDPRVQLQLALSLGEAEKVQARDALANLAVRASDERWMAEAILSSLNTGGDAMLQSLLVVEVLDGAPDVSSDFLRQLSQMIAETRDAETLSQAIVSIAAVDQHPERQHACLLGLQESFERPRHAGLSEQACEAMEALRNVSHEQVASLAGALTVSMRIESPKQREQRLTKAGRVLADVGVPVKLRVAAVEELAAENDAVTIRQLLWSFSTSTPAVQDAILNAVFAQRNHLSIVLSALESQQLPLNAISAVRRESLLKHPDQALRKRAVALFESVETVDEATLNRFTEALIGERDLANGHEVFKRHCATCHQAHGVGFAVGPDLTAEFRRAESTIVQDVLSPSTAISAGFATYVVETKNGLVFNGLLSSETPTGITLRQPEGKFKMVLRKDIDTLRALTISMMPEDLVKKLQPSDVADVIAWIKRPSGRRVLFDDDPAFVDLLTSGDGTASIDLSDKHRGAAALKVTPLQRHSPRIAGWNFSVREHPREGEYRYLRFAWKSTGANGVMIELANDGAWPPASASDFRYFAGENASGWQATRTSTEVPKEWQMVTRDLWQDFGDCTITGIAPTAMGGPALFDAIELSRETP